VTNVRSVLPGTLVQSLITAVHPTGLNLQVLGFFEGTVDQIHLRHDAPEKAYKVGKKVKARVLYDYSSTPPRFALALTEHIVALSLRRIQRGEKSSGAKTMKEAYPIGIVIEAAKVQRLEAERGLLVEIEPGLEGFVHVRSRFLV
jgi:rRNA biogenesis protein RRP5